MNNQFDTDAKLGQLDAFLAMHGGNMPDSTREIVRDFFEGKMDPETMIRRVTEDCCPK